MTSIAAKRSMLVSDVMTPDPVTLPSGASVLEASRLMRDREIGDVLVVDDNLLVAILTDRDVVTRVVAAGGDAEQLTVGEIATRGPVSVRAEQHASEAVKKMRANAVMRLPVVEHGRVVGIVSIGDLALKLEDRSVLAAVFAGQHAED
jgi:CBS domain-containing protein